MISVRLVKFDHWLCKYTRGTIMPILVARTIIAIIYARKLFLLQETVKMRLHNEMTCCLAKLGLCIIFEHPPSLIKVFTVCMKKVKVLTFPMRARLIASRIVQPDKCLCLHTNCVQAKTFIWLGRCRAAQTEVVRAWMYSHFTLSLNHLVSISGI